VQPFRHGRAIALDALGLEVEQLPTMPDRQDSNRNVDQFLQDQIDTIPHLEALLLLWNGRPKLWPLEDMAKALYLSTESTKIILDDLVRLRLAGLESCEGRGEKYCYASEPTRDYLMAAVDATYRRELIRVSRLIHSKPSAAVREFARAFRLKKDSD
jgi:hypothetical protein